MENHSSDLQSISFEKLMRLAKTNEHEIITRAATAYENARIDGLCHEGAWECALQALKGQDIESITKEGQKP